jgi:hypothetical protein
MQNKLHNTKTSKQIYKTLYTQHIAICTTNNTTPSLPQNFLKNKSLLILERKCTNWDQNMKHTMKGTPRRRQWAIA